MVSDVNLHPYSKYLKKLKWSTVLNRNLGTAVAAAEFGVQFGCFGGVYKPK